MWNLTSRALIITSPDTQEKWDGDSFGGWPGTCRYLTSDKPKPSFTYVLAVRTRLWSLVGRSCRHCGIICDPNFPKNALGHAFLGATAIAFYLLVSLPPPPQEQGRAQVRLTGGGGQSIPCRDSNTGTIQLAGIRGWVRGRAVAAVGGGGGRRRRTATACC
eukprot:gene14521-biopygen12639